MRYGDYGKRRLKYLRALRSKILRGVGRIYLGVLPGCGLTFHVRNPGVTDLSPMRPRTMAIAGAEAHGWPQDNFGSPPFRVVQV